MNSIHRAYSLNTLGGVMFCNESKLAISYEQIEFCNGFFGVIITLG